MASIKRQRTAAKSAKTGGGRSFAPSRSSSPPSFADLTPQERRRVAGRIFSTLRRHGYLGRGKYDAVTKDASLRERLYAEQGGEETALTIDERNRLIALIRNLERNSDHINGFLTQLDLNVVGTNGGKASFAFPPEYQDAAIKLRAAFGNWARECEFIDGMPLQEVLKLAIRTKYITGRAVLLFDDGIVCDSGKIIMFEGDAVACIADSEFRARFPEGWSQHQGLIKDEFGRTRGAFCSMSQRGCATFPKLVDDKGRLAVWALVKDADTPWLDSPFAIYQHIKRINQIASVPQIAPSVGSVMDLEALTKYELQSAKKSAQTLATVTQPETDPSGSISDGLDPDARAPLDVNATDAEVDAAVAEATEGAEDAALELPELEGAGAIYDILPPGLKMELLNPHHPNSNVIGMVNWIKQTASWANGVAGLFATGKADSSYSASLVEQAITWPKFEQEQQGLKLGILDWLVRRWAAWALRKGIISHSLKLPPDWIRSVEYSFPVKREPDAQKEQSAINQALRNCTTSLREKFGPDWRERLLLLKEELDFCRENGIPHPALITVSGQTINENLTTDDKLAGVTNTNKEETDE